MSQIIYFEICKSIANLGRIFLFLCILPPSLYYLQSNAVFSVENIIALLAYLVPVIYTYSLSQYHSIYLKDFAISVEALTLSQLMRKFKYLLICANILALSICSNVIIDDTLAIKAATIAISFAALYAVGYTVRYGIIAFRIALLSYSLPLFLGAINGKSLTLLFILYSPFLLFFAFHSLGGNNYTFVIKDPTLNILKFVGKICIKTLKKAILKKIAMLLIVILAAIVIALSHQLVNKKFAYYQNHVLDPKQLIYESMWTWNKSYDPIITQNMYGNVDQFFAIALTYPAMAYQAYLSTFDLERIYYSPPRSYGYRTFFSVYSPFASLNIPPFIAAKKLSEDILFLESNIISPWMMYTWRAFGGLSITDFGPLLGPVITCFSSTLLFRAIPILINTLPTYRHILFIQYYYYLSLWILLSMAVPQFQYFEFTIIFIVSLNFHLFMRKNLNR